MMIKEGEYLFLYNSNKIQDKEARGYALSMDKVKVNDRDIHKAHLTPLQIAEIADYLKIKISALYQDHPSSVEEHYSDDQLIELLAQDPSKMVTPIIISKNKSFIVESPYDLIREKLETQEIKSDYKNRSES